MFSHPTMMCSQRTHKAATVGRANEGTTVGRVYTGATNGRGFMVEKRLFLIPCTIR